MPIKLLWNASASAPVGLYMIDSDGPVEVTDLVAVDAPEPLAAFLAERGYGEPQPVTAAEESLLFALPKELRRDLKAAGMSDQMKHDAGALGDAGQLH